MNAPFVYAMIDPVTGEPVSGCLTHREVLEGHSPSVVPHRRYWHESRVMPPMEQG
jgi:hypothetical protein